MLTPDKGQKLHEECGIFAVSVSNEDRNNFSAAMTTYTALFALQHRGQESCGIAISDGTNIKIKKDIGLVPDVFDEATLASLGNGFVAIGHVHYSAKDDTLSAVSAQPLLIKHASGNLALAFNGSLVNSAQLKQETELHGGIFHTNNDSEVISHIIVREHLRTNTLEDALLNAMHYMIGAYSIVLLTQDQIIAARDPNGYRPLCIGKLDNSWVVASESCAIESLGGQFVRDINPGEVIVIKNNDLRSIDSKIIAKKSLCIFEYIYFARPDSIIDGVSVSQARMIAGQCLAERSTTEADVVIGVPDSGLYAAMGYAQTSGIPYSVGLIKNRYVGRTFIKPAQGDREKAVRIKLNALSATVSGKRVILVDDSIVRGTTCAHIVSLLREAGATEVHMKVSSPPFLHPCYFGTDVPHRSSLIAHNRTLEEIREIIGVDSLQYLEVEDLPKIAPALNSQFCSACFSGEYAVPVPHEK